MIHRGRVVVLIAVFALVVGSTLAAAQGPTWRQPPPVPTKGDDHPTGPGVTPQLTGGPDASGYVFIDSAEAGGPAFSWVDITGSGASFALGDDAFAGPLGLGFSFPFYAGSYTDAFAGSNGQITFGAGDTDFTNPCPIPNGAEPPNPTIAVHWDDLDPFDDGALLYFEAFAAGACPYVPTGVAGSPACAVVLYEDFAHFPGPIPPTAGTFEAILYDTGQVLMQYLDSGDESGSGSTTGIAPGSALDGNGLTYACDTGGSLTDSLAILFGVGAIGDLAITKTPDTDPVPTGSPFTYTIDVVNNGPEDQTGVVVTDDLGAAGLTFIGDTCGGVFAAPTWTWTIGSLANGAAASCDLTVQLDVCGTVVNTATVTGDLADPPADSTATATSNQEVGDPSFEGGSPNGTWTEASTNFGTPLCTIGLCGTGTGTGPRTGDWWSWFGGIAAFEEGSVSQTITIPAAPTATLSFWLEAIVCDSPADYIEVLIDGTQVFVADGSAAFCGVLGYHQETVDVSAYADGAIHTIEFHSEIFAAMGGVSNFFVDDVSVAACPVVLPNVLEIPTLDTVGLVLLTLVLGLGGLLLLRRLRTAG